MRPATHIVTAALLGAAFAALVHAKDADYLPEAHLATDKVIVVLQKIAQGCPANSKRVVLIHRSKAVWLGCWRRVGDHVITVFEDGDTITAPAVDFTWVVAPGAI